MPLLRGLQPDQETQETSKDQRVSKRKSSVIHLWNAGLESTILHNQCLQWDLVMKRKQGWGIIGLKINQGSWNSDLNFLEKSENSFSGGYGENSAAFQVESGCEMRAYMPCIYSQSRAESVISNLHEWRVPPCMGLYRRMEGTNPLDLASWDHKWMKWTCNMDVISSCMAIESSFSKMH